MNGTADLFEAVIELPDRDAQRRYERLVGLEHIKERLEKEAQLLLDPDSLERWSKTHHHQHIAACDAFADRPPMFLFAGDVGTGKTALAETFGDQVGRNLGLPVLLYRLSLSSRGSGAVGEMTQLLASAFQDVRTAAGAGSGRRKTAVVLLIDEADALAQSREASQMHHEDRAGVNALIRGLNSLTEERLPALVVLATNRLDSIDPAVRRRAAATFEFARPNDKQRRAALTALLNGVSLAQTDMDRLVAVTGPQPGRSYGYTYSDLYQRLVPAAILAAFPSKPITARLVLETVEQVLPTPPFAQQAAQ